MGGRLYRGYDHPSRVRRPLHKEFPLKQKRSRPLPSVGRHLGSLVDGNRWLLSVVAATSLVSGFAEASVIYLVVKAASAVAGGEGTVDLSLGPIIVSNASVPSMLLVAIFIIFVLLGLAVANSAAAATMTTRSLNRARKRTFSSFISTSWTLKSQESEGRLQTLLSHHVTQIGSASLRLTNGVTAILNFLAYMVSALLIDPIAAGVVLGGVVTVGVLFFPFTRLSKRLARQNMHLTTSYAGMVAESVRLAQEVSVFDVGAEASERLAIKADEAERVGYRARFIGKLTPKAYQYIALALMAGGIAAASRFNTEDVGELGAIVLLLVRALTYGQQMSTSTQQLAECRPFIEEVEDQQKRYQRHQVTREGEPLGPVSQLRLREVVYGYDTSLPVLANVSFEIEAGDAVGIVGPSGSGKSTLVQILLRLRSPQQGWYEANGRDASKFELDDWYRRFAFVPQDNLLLHASAADNIRFFRPELSQDSVEAAARMAHIHDDLVALPDGYETEIGPGARNLSGGQRQRLGLARALAGEPDVLVLDEPTSALDMRSEELIQQTLHDLRGRMTFFIVAHRMSTLTICDRILVLDRGQLVAQGSHAELQQNSSFYQEALRLSQIAS